MLVVPLHSPKPDTHAIVAVVYQQRYGNSHKVIPPELLGLCLRTLHHECGRRTIVLLKDLCALPRQCAVGLAFVKDNVHLIVRNPLSFPTREDVGPSLRN